MPECPKCGCEHCPAVRTVNMTIRVPGGKKKVVRRRRVCRYCGFDFYTREEDEEPPIPDATAPETAAVSVPEADPPETPAPRVVVPTAPPRPPQTKPASSGSSQGAGEETEPANPFL